VWEAGESGGGEYYKCWVGSHLAGTTPRPLPGGAFPSI
jgi:hypothetical protein